MSEKALWFLADSWSLGERGRQEGGGTHRLLISSLSRSFLSLQEKAVGGHEYRASNPFSFQTAWQGLARRGQPGAGIGTSRIGRGTQKPLSLGTEAAAGPNLRPRYSFPGSQVYTSWLSLCLTKSQRVPEVHRWASVLAWCLGGSQLL